MGYLKDLRNLGRALQTADGLKDFMDLKRFSDDQIHTRFLDRLLIQFCPPPCDECDRKMGGFILARRIGSDQGN